MLGTPPAFILSQDRTLIQWRPFGLLLLRSFLSLAFFLLLLRVFFAALSVLSESLLCPSAFFRFQTETAFAVSNIQGLCMIRSLIFKVLAVPLGQLAYDSRPPQSCQAFYSAFCGAAKRRKRDLNPRAGLTRPTPLAGAPLRPLEYFSL